MSLYLLDDTLGQLDLDCSDGFVVTSFEIGWPQPREVVINRALTDGTIDTTAYLGARAVTVALRLDQRKMPTQDLLDLLLPFLSPRYRPQIVWTVQQPNPIDCPPYVLTPAHTRSLRLRGADAPLVIDGPRYQTIVCQWVAQDPYTSALDERCEVSNLTGTEEYGRLYDLLFDRNYPPSPPFGVTYLYPLGNAPMDWVGVITASVDNPIVNINGTSIIFTGLSLIAGQTIYIDTQNRTILRNNDLSDSVYNLTNFEDWTWDDLRLFPGVNAMFFVGTATAGSPSFTLCWYDRWY